MTTRITARVEVLQLCKGGRITYGSSVTRGNELRHTGMICSDLPGSLLQGRVQVGENPTRMAHVLIEIDN
jgi:hypothetical protein